MNSASSDPTLEELIAYLESCQIDASTTGDLFNHGLLDNPWNFHRNENQPLRVNVVTSPVELASPLGFTAPNNLMEHQSLLLDNFVLNRVVSSMVNRRLASSIEAYLVRLQAVHGQQVTVDQAILLLRHDLISTNPSLHNAHFGHSASPSMPFVPPVQVSHISPDVVITEPGTSARIPVEISAVSNNENALEVYDANSLRRIFLDGDRVKVECLWPNCGRTLMKDNHSRHVRECHLRAKRGVTRKNRKPFVDGEGLF